MLVGPFGMAGFTTIGMYGHPDVMKPSTRTCCLAATALNSLNQVAACESPTSATTVELVRSPPAQYEMPWGVSADVHLGKNTLSAADCSCAYEAGVLRDASTHSPARRPNRDPGDRQANEKRSS